MKQVEKRTIEIAKELIDQKLTIRSVAKRFGLAKSSVHYDLKNRLPKLDYFLYLEVRILLEKNFKEKNIRGGLATKKRYEILRQYIAK